MNDYIKLIGNSLLVHLLVRVKGLLDFGLRPLFRNEAVFQEFSLTFTNEHLVGVGQYNNSVC